MENKTQVKQEVETGTGRSLTRYRYENFNTPKKPNFKTSITDLKEAVFTQGRPYNAKKSHY